LDQGTTGGLVSNKPKVGAPKAAKVVNNQGLIVFIDEGNSLVNLLEGDDRKDGPKDLSLHQRRIGGRVHDHSGSQVSICVSFRVAHDHIPLVVFD
jgi:hypothetical protein